MVVLATQSISQECQAGNQLHATNKERIIIHLAKNTPPPSPSPTKAKEHETQAIPIASRGEKQDNTKEQQTHTPKATWRAQRVRRATR